MDKNAKNFREFLDSARSSYHVVALLEKELKGAGYEALAEQENWRLQPGGKYYLTRGGNSLIAFRMPEKKPVGFMMSAAHCDRPTFKVKENGELVGKYTRLATEKYGGMLISTWLDRPLSVAGRVVVETEDGTCCRVVDIDRDLLLIPNVAIHMNRKANEGYTWNPAVDTLPLLGGKDAAGKLAALLEGAAGGKVLGHDLYLYVRQPASVWGVEEEYLSAPGLDDLGCVWCCKEGLLNAVSSDAVSMLCVFDSEEVGSGSVQGAGSTFLGDAIKRICDTEKLDMNIMLRGSFMLSADNANALHPNHPEYSDEKNAPIMGEGVVLKFNAALRYTTDGATAAIFRKICKKADVPVQTYYNRADLPGGSTLGCVSQGQVSVPAADIGLPQLAMHSSFETVSLQDVRYLEKVMAAYYSSTLQLHDDGSCTVK